MRLSQNEWPKDKSYDGYLFFGQVVEELLNPESLASYKCPTLTTASRVDECIDVIDKIKNNSVKAHHLDNVVDELLLSLDGDFVAKSLIQPNLKLVKQGLSDRSQLAAMKKALLFVKSKLDHGYFSQVCKFLEDELRSGLNKDRIYVLASVFTSHLNYSGYAKRSVYLRNRDFFISEKKKISEKMFKEFIDRYDFESKVHLVHVRVNKVLYESSRNATANFQAISDEEIPPVNKKGLKSFQEAEYGTMRMRKRALDARGATAKADQQLSDLKSLFILYFHKTDFKWHDTMIVCYTDQKRGLIYDTPKSEAADVHEAGKFTNKRAMRKKIDLFASATSTADGYDKLSSSLTGHATAMETHKPETQFITLWSSIETLLPSDVPYASIENYLEHIMPAIMCGYSWQVFKHFYDECHRLYGEEFSDFIEENLSGSDLLEEFVAIVVLEDRESQRFGELAKFFEGNPLALYRLRCLRKSFSSAKRIEHTLKGHHERVRRQVRRIYRVRNEIVHSGETVKFINPLLSNLHEYYDTMMINFDFHAALFHDQLDVGSVFDSMGVYYQAQLDNVKTCKERQSSLTRVDLPEVLGFGPYKP